MNIKALIGSGDRIGRVLLPFLAIGLAANVLRPESFSVGGPPAWLATLAVAMLVPGVVMWLWSVVLILTRVPRGELITTGPYSLVKHPLYTAVGLLVLPAAGILLDSWLGIVLGLVIYLGSRRYAPAEEETLSRAFGQRWTDYAAHVRMPWV